MYKNFRSYQQSAPCRWEGRCESHASFTPLSSTATVLMVLLEMHFVCAILPVCFLSEGVSVPGGCDTQSNTLISFPLMLPFSVVISKPFTSWKYSDIFTKQKETALYRYCGHWQPHPALRTELKVSLVQIAHNNSDIWANTNRAGDISVVTQAVRRRRSYWSRVNAMI